MSYSKRSKSSRNKTPASTQTVVWIAVGAFALLAVCCGCWFAFAPLMQSVTQPGTQKVAPPSAELAIAYSPEKAELWKSLVDSFNAQGNKTPGGKHTWEILTSLAATCHQRGQDFVNYLSPRLALAPATGR